MSGGGDSIALLRLTAAWARGRRPVLALTVDHGLQAESAAWTAFAGDAARALGCDWRGLRWDGPKPSTGLPAKARAARHALLAQAAREAGAGVILTGHTADDVLEGERMREADAPALGRLRAWSPSPAWPEGRGLFLLRPLLGTTRAELRAWLRGQGASWIEDPANEDLSYARARARFFLPSPAQRGRCLGPQDGDGGGPGHASHTHPLRPCAAAPEHLPRSAGEGKAGLLVLSPADLTASTLSAALLCAAGTTRPPRGEPLARLLARVRAGERFTATLAGARIEADGATVVIIREPGERRRGGLASLALTPGRAVVWDGRFELVACVPGLSIAPLAGLAARLSPAERAAIAPLAPAARAALPVLVDAADGVSLPAPFGCGPAVARCLVRARFAAAIGFIPDEAALRAQAQPAPPHGAGQAITLC